MRILAQREPWMDDGACRQPDVDLDLFFPTRGQTAAPARAICADCPVRQECLAYALDHPWLHGIWAGLTARQRREHRREQP